jgi:hypothetical protein
MIVCVLVDPSRKQHPLPVRNNSTTFYKTQYTRCSCALKVVELCANYSSWLAGDKLYSISIEYKTAANARRGLSLEWETLGPYSNSRKEASEQMPYQDSAASSRLVHSGHSEFPFPAFSERGGQGEISGVKGEKSHGSVPLEVIGPAFYHLPQTRSVVQRDDYVSWDTDMYDASQPLLTNSQVRRRDVWSANSACPAEGGSEAYDRCRGKGLAGNDALRVKVNPGLCCASKTTALGDSLTIGTAGVTRTFTLTARDAYDNQRDAFDDSFIAEALVDLQHVSPYPSTDNAVAVHSRFRSQPLVQLLTEGETANPPSDPGGKYEGEYVATISGMYNMRVESVDTSSNGLLASYFPGSTAVYSEQLARRDATIDFNWALAAPDVNVPPGGVTWHARWHGLIKAQISSEYTFFLETDGQATVKIRAHLVLSSSDTGQVRTWSGTIALVADVLNEIEVQFTHLAGPARMHLRWQTAGMPIEIVPSSQFFGVKQLVALGQTRLLVRPNLISPARSQIGGTGMSLCTAGVVCTFAITTKDEFGNMREDAQDILVSTLVPGDLPSRASLQAIAQQPGLTFADAQGQSGATVPSAGVSKGAATAYDSSADPFAYQTGNRHPFAYMSTRAGTSTLHVVAAYPAPDMSGSIRDIRVLSGGSAYLLASSALNVSCQPPCSGQGLVGVCHSLNGSIVAVHLLQRGAGYSAVNPPNVSCFGTFRFGGSDAMLQATVSGLSYSEAQGTGLFASYYDDADFGGPARISEAGHVLDFSCAKLNTPLSLDNDGSFAGLVTKLSPLPLVTKILPLLHTSMGVRACLVALNSSRLARRD